MNLNKQHSKYGGVRWVTEGHGGSKQCPIDRSVKMISPSGDVVTVALATGSNIPRNRNRAYEEHILETKRSKGWVEYDSLPEAKREKLIAERKEAKFKRTEGMRDSFKTATERVQEATQANFDKLIATMQNKLEDGGSERKG